MAEHAASKIIPRTFEVDLPMLLAFYSPGAHVRYYHPLVARRKWGKLFWVTDHRLIRSFVILLI